MRAGSLVRLDRQPRHLRRLDEYVLAAAKNAVVLNVGAAGGVFGYLPDGVDAWMHAKLARTAAVLRGIDIDAEGISYAARHGYCIVKANCETDDLGGPYDFILMSDVIEHVDSPTRAVVNLARHLRAGGRLVLTTPNATSLGTLLRAAVGRPPAVYWDHMTLFTPEHVQSICDRHGLRLTDVGFFSSLDRRAFMTRMTSRLVAAAGTMNPRWHASFLVCIETAE